MPRGGAICTERVGRLWTVNQKGVILSTFLSSSRVSPSSERYAVYTEFCKPDKNIKYLEFMKMARIYRRYYYHRQAVMRSNKSEGPRCCENIYCLRRGQCPQQNKRDRPSGQFGLVEMITRFVTVLEPLGHVPSVGRRRHGHGGVLVHLLLRI
jgi:hypothetical protein